MYDIGNALTCNSDGITEVRFLYFNNEHETALDWVFLFLYYFTIYTLYKTLSSVIVTFKFRGIIDYPKTATFLCFLVCSNHMSPFLLYELCCFIYSVLIFHGFSWFQNEIYNRGYYSGWSVYTRTPKTIKVKRILDSQSSMEVYDWAKERRGDYNRRKQNSQRKKKEQKKISKNRNARRRNLKSQSGVKTAFQFAKVVQELRTWASSVTDFTNPMKSFYDLLSNHTSHIRQCELWRQAQLIFSMFITIGVLSVKEYTFHGIKIFSDNNLRRPVSLLEIIEAIWTFLTMFWERFMHFCETLDIRSFYLETFSDKISDEYTFLVTNFVLIEAGKNAQERIDVADTDSPMRDVPIQEYDRRLHEFVTTLNLKLAICKDQEKSGYTAKLREIKSYIAKRRLASRKAARIKPFSLLIYGGSGVAKSSIITSIARAILEMNGYASSEGNVITLNEVDKFQSEYRTHHSGVIFDDLCNMRADRITENPLDKVISFINTIPMCALNPNVELKGNILIEPKFCAATTNRKDLQAPIYSNEALAILRRYDYTITQTIRPQYQKQSGMLDSDKVEHMLGNPFPDFALFTVEVPRYENQTVEIRNKKGSKTNTSGIAWDLVYHKGKPLKDINIRELMEFLRDVSKKFYRQQEAIAAAKNAEDSITLCENENCRLPRQLCKCASAQFVTPEQLEVEEAIQYCKQCEHKPQYCDCDDCKINGEPENDSPMCCEACYMPKEMCNCQEMLDSQTVISDLIRNVTNSLLNFEHMIYQVINTRYLDCLLSIPGMIYVLSSNFPDYCNHIRNLYTLHFYAICLLICLDMTIRVPLMIFIFVVLFTLQSIMKTTRQYVMRTIVEMAAFRRPSELWSDLAFRTKYKIMIGFLSLFGYGIVSYLVQYFGTYTFSEAAEACANEDLAKHFPATVDKEDDDEEDRPFWSTIPRILKYAWKSPATHRARTMSITQGHRVMEKRQWIMQVSKSSFSFEHCNCIPIDSDVLLIPAHIVPDTPQSTKIITPEKEFTYPLERKKTYRIPGTDFALWYCKRVGSQKPLYHLFAEALNKGNVAQFDLLFYDENEGFQNLGKYAGTFGKIRSSKGGNYQGYTYYKPDGTFNGLCMATALVNTKEGHPFICGFHLAGKGTTGAIAAITEVQLRAGVAELEKSPGRMRSHNECPIEQDVAGIHFSLCKEIKEGHALRKLPPKSVVDVHGAHDQPVGSFDKSKVVISEISDIVTKHTGIEREHGKATGLGDIKHKIADLTRKTNTACNFDEECFQRACVDLDLKLSKGLTNEQLSSLSKISDDVNLAGFDGATGVNAIELTTSMGFPFRGKKKLYVKESDRRVSGITRTLDAEPWIWDVVNDREETLGYGLRTHMTFKASMKDEPTKITKEKRRVFAGSNIADTLLIRRYFLTFSALVQQNKHLFECAVGIDVHSPEFTKLMKYLAANGEDRIIAGDYKSFDSQMACEFMTAAFKSAIKLMVAGGNFDEQDVKVLKGIATEICNPTYDYFGVILTLNGSNPSGHPLTTIINSLVNSLYMRYTYYVIAKEEQWKRVPLFHEVVNLITYGDDNEMGVKRGYDAFNHTRISEVLARSGIEYTMADKESKSVPFINLKDASFLKHFPVWNPDLNLYGAKIEDSSIAKMLHTHMDSNALNEQEQNAESLKNVARAWFGFGREYYEENVPKLYAIAKEAGIAHIVGDLKTYDQRVIEYKKKFKLDSDSVLDCQKGKKPHRPGFLDFIKLMLSMFITIAFINITAEEVMSRYHKGIYQKKISYLIKMARTKGDKFVSEIENSYHLNGAEGLCEHLGLPKFLAPLFRSFFGEPGNGDADSVSVESGPEDNLLFGESFPDEFDSQTDFAFILNSRE